MRDLYTCQMIIAYIFRTVTIFFSLSVKVLPLHFNNRATLKIACYLKVMILNLFRFNLKYKESRVSFFDPKRIFCLQLLVN